MTWASAPNTYQATVAVTAELNLLTQHLQKHSHSRRWRPMICCCAVLTAAACVEARLTFIDLFLLHAQTSEAGGSQLAAVLSLLLSFVVAGLTYVYPFRSHTHTPGDRGMLLLCCIGCCSMSLRGSEPRLPPTTRMRPPRRWRPQPCSWSILAAAACI